MLPRAIARRSRAPCARLALAPRAAPPGASAHLALRNNAQARARAQQLMLLRVYKHTSASRRRALWRVM